MHFLSSVNCDAQNRTAPQTQVLAHRQGEKQKKWAQKAGKKIFKESGSEEIPDVQFAERIGSEGGARTGIIHRGEGKSRTSRGRCNNAEVRGLFIAMAMRRRSPRRGFWPRVLLWLVEVRGEAEMARRVWLGCGPLT